MAKRPWTASATWALLAACGASTSGPVPLDSGADSPRMDSGADVDDEDVIASDALPDRGRDAQTAPPDASDAPPEGETGPESSSPDANDAGPCTQPLSQFSCASTYPVPLPPFDCSCAPNCGGGPIPWTPATCGSFAAVLQGGPPHYGFCVYENADGGALVGAEVVTDVTELCNGTSYIITGGQVPTGCEGDLLTAFYDAGGWRTGTCGDAAVDAEPDSDAVADVATDTVGD